MALGPAWSSPAGPTLAELARVIRRIEDKHRRELSPAGRVPASLEEALGGAVEETAHGPVLCVRRRYPLAHRHGEAPLGQACAPADASLALLARGEPSAAPLRLLYLDTETTGLAGGTGTYAFLVGAGYFDGDAFEVSQYFMRDLDEEPALLAALEGLFARFDAFVTYNGRVFDLPLLETRFVLGRRRFPEERPHVDLLAPARRLWGGCLADCRLGTVESEILRFGREGDLPGAMIPAVYFEYLRRKRPGALPRVFDHNRHDVLALAALLGRMSALLEEAPAPSSAPEELLGLGRLLETADPGRASACYHMALERGLRSPARERLLLHLARHEKRRARWDEARRLWEAAAGHAAFDPRPWEELAKMYEHRLRDLARARMVVEEALGRARADAFPAGVLAAFDHRLARLVRRAARAPEPVAAGPADFA